MATYIIILKVSKNSSVVIGRIGETAFKRGLYLYIGSARRALEKRIGRHLKKEKVLHWHIDHILASQSIGVLEVWTRTTDEECEAAKAISRLPETEVVKSGIGSSDCRCPTHFYSFKGTLSAIHKHLKEFGFERKQNLI